MPTSARTFDAAVIGGGLAGVTAAARLTELGARTLLVDRGLPQAAGQLGGFAKFSGAKFSLPPAGLGLIPVAGSRERLLATIAKVLAFLGIEHEHSHPSEDLWQGEERALDSRTLLRSYRSIVLTPDRIDALIEHVTARLDPNVTIVRAGCRGLADHAGQWRLELGDETPASCEAVFCAGGRSGPDLLAAAGASPVAGKGIDVGMRVEFPNKEGLRGLRALGPDAKILAGKCRTFCLNVPGRVYRYVYEHLTIPGGVVAEPGHPAGNVGLLRRVANKQACLRAVMHASRELPVSVYEDPPVIAGVALGPGIETVARLFGEEIADQLEAFAQEVGRLGLVDWNSPHRIHLPLLDWHWSVYARPGSFATNVPGIYALGDSSGHARGLLQAAVSGWLAAEEYAS